MTLCGCRLFCKTLLLSKKEVAQLPVALCVSKDLWMFVCKLTVQCIYVLCAKTAIYQKGLSISSETEEWGALYRDELSRTGTTR